MKIEQVIKQVRAFGVKGVVDYLRRAGHDWQVRRYLRRNADQHRATVPVPGLTIIAPMSGAYSLSKAMRDFVVRLREAGVPHQVFDCCKPDVRVAVSDYSSLVTPLKEFNILKYSTTVEMLTSPLPANLTRCRARIAFWEGEHGILNVFPYLADSDVVIAMSDYNADYYRRELPEHVRVAKVIYPLPSVPKSPIPRDEVRNKYGLGRNDFVVFFNFDLHALYRKNPKGLMRAFATAFPDEKSARLVFKVNHSRTYPERLVALRQLANELKIADRFTVIDGYLPMDDIYGLTAACDVYASLHRSEGFGLGIAEAMQYGIPVVVSDYSASREFCNAETSLLVPCQMVSITDKSFAGNMKEYAAPDESVAAAALRRLFDDRAFARELGLKGKTFVEDHFSMENFKESISHILTVESQTFVGVAC